MEEAMMVVFNTVDPLMGMDTADNQIDRPAMREAMNEAIAVVLPKWTEGLVPHVAAAFTEEELAAMVAFYESPIGQSVVAKSQTLAKPSMDVMTGLMPDFAADMLSRYCEKAECDDSLKARGKRRAS
jgi:uncharacterized protein